MNQPDGPDPAPRRPVDQASHVVMGPEEGVSYWQPQPSCGYVTVQLTPANMPYDTFSSGLQVLPPGCSVREHGHARNHELVHVAQGRGSATIDGETYRLEPGSTVLFGRHSRHLIVNDGAEEMRLFWVFFPPGLEDWFHAIGRPRTAGEAAPAPFPRPDNVAEVQARMRFLPPRAPA